MRNRTIARIDNRREISFQATEYKLSHQLRSSIGHQYYLILLHLYYTYLRLYRPVSPTDLTRLIDYEQKENNGKNFGKVLNGEGQLLEDEAAPCPPLLRALGEIKLCDDYVIQLIYNMPSFDHVVKRSMQ